MFGKHLKLFVILVLSSGLFLLYVKNYLNFNDVFNFHQTSLIKNSNELRVDHKSGNYEYYIISHVKLFNSSASEFLDQEIISRNIPYLPIEELQSPTNFVRSYNSTCAWHPGIMDIYIRNEYWQLFHGQNITYYVFGAYLDTRPLATANKTIIRILAMIDFISESDQKYPPAYCQVWFRNKSTPTIVPVVSTKSIWMYKWGHSDKQSYPHIISCQLPESYETWIPKTVSLVAAPCNAATNILRVVYRPLKASKEKQEFAVCIKGMDFPYIDKSYRFVEYIEAVRALGAHKLIVYNLQIHVNITKVLNYYEARGFLEQRPFSFSLQYSNLPEYRRLQKSIARWDFVLHESIALTDCIYRNMYQFKYIGVWDWDELPIPLNNHYSWHDLVILAQNSQTQKCKSYASFCFLCAYFPKYEGNFTLSKQFPDYLYMLQHVLRVQDHARYGFAMKCLHDTDRVIATHNHFPIHFKADCRDYTFRSSDAQMNHYREPDYEENLTNPVIDKGLRRFGRTIMENSIKVFKELDFLTEP